MSDDTPPLPQGATLLPLPKGATDQPTEQPTSALDIAKGVGNAAERAVGGSLINAITFIPDIAVQGANAVGGVVDKALGIQEPDIELPSTFWQSKLDKHTKAPDTISGKILEGVTTAVGAGAAAGLRSVTKGTERLAEQILGKETPPKGLVKPPRGMRTAEKAPPLTRVTTKAAEDAMTAGYNLTPAYVGGVLGKGVQTAIGKASAHRAASLSNEAITDRLAKAAIALDSSHELTPENLSELEEDEYGAYEEVRHIGPMSLKDGQFYDKVREAADRFRLAPEERPEHWTPQGFERGAAPKETYTMPGIAELKSRYLDRKTLNSNEAVDDIRSLRYSSHLNLTGLATPKERALGYVQRQIADALEEQLGRSAKGDALQRFQEARVRIAKIRTVRDVMGPGGHLNARELSRLNDARPGMLTGQLKLIADTYKNFEKDMQLITPKGEEGDFSVVDYLLGGTGLITGHVAVPGLSLLRPVARHTLLTEGVQERMLKNVGKRSAERAKPKDSAIRQIGRAAARGALIQTPEQLGAISGQPDLGDQSP